MLVYLETTNKYSLKVAPNFTILNVQKRQDM